MTSNALIIDSSPLFNAPLAQYLAEKGFNVAIVEHPSEAIALLRQTKFRFVAIGKGDPGFPFFELCSLVKELQPEAHLVTLGILGESTRVQHEHALGALAHLNRPFSIHALQYLFEHLPENPRSPQPNTTACPKLPTSLIAESPAMRAIVRELFSIADSKAHVFLTGESGTGKEIIAETIHALSPRKEKPFIKINCAAIPESLIESEFFGHEKGAFTGALLKKSGRLELAHEGTLLLDEITESPLSFQAKLLRAVQQQQFERVGS
ncbi:MAG: sigma-54-dependent Fis family transcriptional regulator, partial [Simkania sp.]|nr:sigma-54-dependent Fis family transcriptional regulator [Simkania sp.]